MAKEIIDNEAGMNRRVFIKGLGLVSTGFILSTIGGCQSIIDAIANRPVRLRIRPGNAAVTNALNIYRDGVQQMKSRAATDPRSYAFQAALHGTSSGFRFCQHGTNHFFSWHRAYLLYFERIIQTLTNEPTWGLPYWNWNQNPAIHPAFLDASSALFESRNRTSLAGFSAFQTSNLDTIIGDSNFFSFSSQLEGSPHNNAHSLIGQTMGDFDSPLDPLFWTHHCMVDYCWAKWNNELGNDNTNDPGWTNTSWNHFVDGDGNPVSSITAGITTVMPLLSYRYETSAIGSNPARLAGERTAEERRRLERRVRRGADVQFEVTRRVGIADVASIPLDRTFSSETQLSGSDFSAIVDSDIATERIFASVRYADMPTTSDFLVRVFLNRPDANISTSTDDPHFAGTFAFFGVKSEDEHDGHPHKTDFLVNLTPTLRRLKRAGALSDGRKLSIQLVPVPTSDAGVPAGARLNLHNIEIIVSPVFISTNVE